MMEKFSLLTLFMPPKDYSGDFGMFCGFTATRPVLDRIKRSFSAEMSRPMLAAFIHPTTAAVNDVPGLAWIWMNTVERQRGYRLLHAKVALLGFRAKTGDGYVIRLAVTTGNWTSDPLSDSIDLFWSVDIDTVNPDPDPQACADLRAAWEMFGWLRERGDCSLIDRKYDGHLPDKLLREKLERLPASNNTPRFIDSRQDALMPQVVERLASDRRRDRLIVGSGYFESAGNTADTVPERLRRELVRKAKLKKDARHELVLNLAACQGLAGNAERLAQEGWEFRRPVSVDHRDDAKLHAKFVLLASGDGNDPCEGRLYLGSGNMTARGFEEAAQGGGNLEAGIVLSLPKGIQWRGNGSNGIHRYLPIGGGAAITPTDMQAGADFERPEEPQELPEVAFLLWAEGLLIAPDKTDIEVLGPEGHPISTPCAWPGEAPAFVTLVKSCWRVPVVANDALVVPRPRDMTVEDVLAGLGSFPEPVERDMSGDGEAGAEAEIEESNQRPKTEAANYALRRMMELLVRLSEVQSRIDRRDWPRWCRELRDNLTAITEQEQPMLGFFREAGTNPLPALLGRRMLPKGGDRSALDQALRQVAEHWGLSGFPSLWAKGDA